MTSSRQARVAITIGCVISLSLSACSLVGGAGQLWDAAASDLSHVRALDAAAAELENIGGVQSASARFTSDTPEGDAAELHVVVAVDLPREQAQKISAVSRETFTSAEFETAVPLLTLSTAHDGAGVLSRGYFEFSDEKFADDFVYWRAIEKTIGTELSMSLTEGLVTDTYLRTFKAPDGVDAVATAERIIDNFTALAALHDETKNPTMWELSGMRSYPNLPSAEAAALLDEIRHTIALVDYSQLPPNPEPEFDYPEGVLLMWTTPVFEGPTIVEILITHSEYRESDWDAVLHAAARAAELPNLNFRYAAGEQQFQLHTSTCEGTVAVSADDRKLFDAIPAGGVEFLPGAGPGACIPEQ